MGSVQPAACENTSSPLKRLRAGTQEELFMKRASKEAAGDASKLKQARSSQTKAGNQARSQHMADKQPTEREMAAAKAARARLYGDEGSAKEMEVPTAKEPTGTAPKPTVDVEQLPYEQLTALETPETDAQAALADMASGDWAIACRGLLTIRRLSKHHSQECRALLDKIMPLVLKHVKSLRSSLCKAAVMCVGDLFAAHGSRLLPLLDAGGVTQPAKSLLAQLLLKAGSNDKKFVIDEVQRALGVMATSMDAPAILGRLLPYAAHKNPKVRGKVATCLAASAAEMTPEQWQGYPAKPLLVVAGKLVSDNTPEARDSAKSLISILRGAFEVSASTPDHEASDKENTACEDAPVKGSAASKGADAVADEAAGSTAQDRWARHCHSTLGAVAAASILKASNCS
ncbi:g5513 [Coccomyxa viridis]|uniref:G5513 protein n=1 Tax=Coccomyxa viridis TaxID=1274662 RepID=A0ABP1FVI9_9CHLO